MNGIHDMGGMDGFGAVAPEQGEPVFHAPWEGRVMAMYFALSALGEFTADVGRYWVETLPPEVYLSTSYYERWLTRFERQLPAFDLVTEAELAAGHAAGPGRPIKGKVLAVSDVGVPPPIGPLREAPRQPSFKVGDRVRAKNIHPRGHTRLPRYVRGRVGVIERMLDCQSFPDSVVISGDEDPQWVYTVTFTGDELWGPDGEPGLSVSIDAYEPYLEAA
jgi:nitrile hydratase